MNRIIIKGTPSPAQSGDFRYSNVESAYGVNTRYFTKNGKPYTVISGELHFARVPRERWRETLLKLRECGVNTVSTYVFWNYHNEKKGVFDFSGNKDIAAFLALCRDVAMPCILRIGPWCHGEAARGGFPLRIDRMRGRRSDDPAYLAAVREFWQALYGEVRPFMDGETVLGIQLENEYGGPVTHLLTLRRMAEEIGFKAPFFTVTAWPNCVRDPALLPLTGGYPDAPWERGTFPLPPHNRFAISAGRVYDEIGTAVDTQGAVGDYAGIPYACCETGPGNQVTQHRRPYIGEKDGWGVGFAKFASGAAWLGYYMFCGGANPNDRLLQESRFTGYPNDYPIIDYDFQAPLSRWGVCRPHGDRLRLLHLFIKEFDPEISAKQAFFPVWPTGDPTDASFLKCCVRADEQGCGYFFAGAYEKGMDVPDYDDTAVRVELGEKKIDLPRIDVKGGAMVFYPFNVDLGGVRFDYILAQPLVKTERGGETVCYFAQCEGIAPRYAVGGKAYPLDFSETGTPVGNVRLIVLPYEEARRFHFINGRAYFTDGTVYCNGGKVFCERTAGPDLKDLFDLRRTAAKNLPYNKYLYSTGKRAYYELKLPVDAVAGRPDVRLEFAFTGLNLQVFSGETLIDDCFNTDGTYVLHLRDYMRYLKENDTFTIRAAPKTRTGISAVYNEIPIPLNETGLTLKSALEYRREELP